ncbi:tripartite tricarboxylate transporter TctB family protein [Pseudokineococcus sp. 1T1Z-3]|uniref:tripartite tricarboxylate transporter TctB family protein n=1 Tax=Pseudokineococcus sp. 1T1Z-3 TaxID=3132745 RepID=UPI0030ADB08F
MSGGGDAGQRQDRPVEVTATGVATGAVRRSDLVGTGALAALGLVAAALGWQYGFLVDGEVGPGFLPVSTGAFILLASLAELARMSLQRRAARADGHVDAPVGDEQAAAVPADAGGGEDEELDVFGRTSAQRSRAIAVVFGLLFAALLLVPLVGLLLSLSLAVLVLLLLVERKPPLQAGLGALACFGFGYLVFERVLGVPLPSGALGLV